MASTRYLFGFTPADFAVTVGDDDTLKVAPGVTGTVYPSLVGGSAITDLLDVASSPVTVVTADSDGRVAFYGPAGVTVVFVDFGDGRYRMDAADAGLAAEDAFWTPSDPTGASDLTAELEAFRTANPGKTIRVASGSTIKLANAFASATTGDILLDLTGVTVLYLNTATAAIKCTNTANASAEVTVSALAMAEVNENAYVTVATLASTLAAQRFQWMAIYSADPNPALSGGVLGEICQVLNAEATLQVALNRKLNRHEFYTTGIKARRLDGTRKVRIIGGRFKAAGDTEDRTITVRGDAIQIVGFVDPVVENVTLDHLWRRGIVFQACAAPKWRNIEFIDVGNLDLVGGVTYGVTLYGMNDQATGLNTIVRNGRHPAFTTVGSSISSNWYDKGIPTNAVLDGVHGYNCHSAVVDTHEAGDNLEFRNVSASFTYQDADSADNPDSSSLGTAVQLRAANCKVRGLTVTGGSRGVRVNAVDHGFQDLTVLDDIRIHDTTRANNGDIGVQVDDMSALANRRHVVLGGEFVNVGIAVQAGKRSRVTITQLDARRCKTGVDARAGADVLLTGSVTFDYRGSTRPTPYRPFTAASDAINGGCSIVSLNPVSVVKGTAAAPTVVVSESDTTASKKLWIPRLRVFDPSSSGVPAVIPTTATTFEPANVFDLDGYFNDKDPGEPDEGPPDTPLAYPQDVLPGMSRFKLTLPTGTGTTPDEIFQTALATYSNANWFHLNGVGDGVEMAANCGGVTTGASSYTRSEFREMEPNSTVEAGWEKDDGKTHTLHVTQVINQLPVARPIIITSQIHPDGASNFLFIVADGMHPTAGTVAATGTNTTIAFNIYCKINDASGDQVEYIPILTGYKLGQTFSTKLEVLDGKVNVYCNLGTSATELKATITANIPSAANLYFKAGCYLQSNTTNTDKTVPPGLTVPLSGQPTGGDSPTAGGKVTMKALTVTHVDTPGGVTPVAYPADLMGQNWKVTLPDASEIKQPAFATYSGPAFKLNPAKDGVVFDARCNGATTPNTSNPRSELRERSSNGTVDAAWSTPSSGTLTHTMIYTASVDELPIKKPEVTVGQIHAAEDPPDDQLVVLASGFYPTSGTTAVTGTNTSIGFDLRFRWLGSTKLAGVLLPVLIPDLHIGEKFSIKMQVVANRYRIWAKKDPFAERDFTGVAEATASVTLTLVYAGTSYFKLGDYVQSNLTNADKHVPAGTCAGGLNLTSPPANALTGGDAATAGGKVTIWGTPTITHV